LPLDVGFLGYFSFFFTSSGVGSFLVNVVVLFFLLFLLLLGFLMLSEMVLIFVIDMLRSSVFVVVVNHVLLPCVELSFGCVAVLVSVLLLLLFLFGGES
jgi:hypothetical protein